MDKLLFLDIDGVLNHAYTKDCVHVPADHFKVTQFFKHDEVDENGIVRLEGLHGMDREAVERLNRLCAAVPDLEVVLSSTWRRTMGAKYTEMNMRRQGYTGPRIMHTTPTDVYARKFSEPVRRGHEIQAWLDRNLSDEARAAARFVILDDDSDMVHLTDTHLVQTDPYVGLTDANVDECIKRLNG
jgi:hypothetical protein